MVSGRWVGVSRDWQKSRKEGDGEAGTSDRVWAVGNRGWWEWSVWGSTQSFPSALALIRMLAPMLQLCERGEAQTLSSARFLQFFTEALVCVLVHPVQVTISGETTVTLSTIKKDVAPTAIHCLASSFQRC